MSTCAHCGIVRVHIALFFQCSSEFTGSTQILKKVIRTLNIPIKTKIFSKKLFFVPSKWKKAKSLYGSYPTEFAGLAQNPKKKISEYQIN
jgi:hypothetical protein